MIDQSKRPWKVGQLAVLTENISAIVYTIRDATPHMVRLGYRTGDQWADAGWFYQGILSRPTPRQLKEANRAPEQRLTTSVAALAQWLHGKAALGLRVDATLALSKLEPVIDATYEITRKQGRK